MTTPQTFLECDRGMVVAPAGCGKTELVARAVSVTSSGRQLVLTHTHAGVDALRRRLRKYRVDVARYRVDTIAGFCLRLAASFPSTSGLTDPRPSGPGWNAVYGAALRVIQAPIGQHVVRASYSGLIVDEYQDCTQEQHQVVLALADVLPTRLVGDPLQGIFGFGGQRLVDWKQLREDFEELSPLHEPWRWASSNPDLGRWLLKARGPLTASEPLDVSDAPVQVLDGSTRAKHVLACHRVAAGVGSVVAIRKWAKDAHATSQRLGGRFTSMEEMDCKDLQKFGHRLDSETGTQLVNCVIDFAKSCMTEVGQHLSTTSKQLAQGRAPRARQGSVAFPAVATLAAIVERPDAGEIAIALQAIRRLPGTKVYRRELFAEALRTVRSVGSGEYDTYADAAWSIRDHARHRGRRLDKRIISRTLLIKGLEFDHSLVLDPSEFDAKNLYVALTRGSSSLTVLTEGADSTLHYVGT